MSGSIILRRIRAGEGPQLMQVRLSALLDAPDAFESTYETSSKRPIDAWQARAGAAAEGESETVMIAESGSQWLAMAGAFSSERGRRVLFGMWVDPAWRRRGIANRLVSAVAEWAQAAGAPELTLWVAEENIPAVTLYRRQGFQPTGARKPMAGTEGVYEIEMSLALSGQ